MIERRAPVPRPSSNIKTTINPSPFGDFLMGFSHSIWFDLNKFSETRKYERIHQLLHSIQNTVNTILENQVCHSFLWHLIFLLNLQESSGIFTKENLKRNIPTGVIERSSLVRWPDDEDYEEEEEEDDKEVEAFIGPENRRIDYHYSPALISTFF